MKLYRSVRLVRAEPAAKCRTEAFVIFPGSFVIFFTNGESSGEREKKSGNKDEDAKENEVGLILVVKSSVEYARNLQEWIYKGRTK